MSTIPARVRRCEGVRGCGGAPGVPTAAAASVCVRVVGIFQTKCPGTFGRGVSFSHQLPILIRRVLKINLPRGFVSIAAGKSYNNNYSILLQ